jgi:hypothetical protein|tara:strand:+ start:2854 stop:3075 length:222 start_codon:yes stop_codon:yes gene_type:complete
MEIDKQLRNALRLKYQGDIAAAKANITIYMNSSVGIGEHSDIISAIDEQLNLLATADDKLNTLEKHFEPQKVI